MEEARYWRAPDLPGVDLLRARYRTHRFLPHAHETYALGVIEAGAERFRHRGAEVVAPAGSVVLIPPGEAHTGEAAHPAGWRYRMLYVHEDWLRDAHVPLGGGGLPALPAPVLHDPQLAAALLRAHHALDGPASTLAREGLLRAALDLLVRHHATGVQRPHLTPDAGELRAARDLLEASATHNLSLSELAAQVGLSPHHLARRFTATFGLPPHAYQLQVRVRLARHLLDAGRPPAEVAQEVGFADQAHLTRVFKRVLGVPPGAYRRAR